MDQNCKKKLVLIRDLIKRQQYKEALQQTQIIMYKYSKVFQVHLMAGLCYEKLGKNKQSEAAYLEVLDLKPGEVNAIKCLCDLYTKIGDVQKSTRYLQSMIAIQKNSQPLKYRQNLVKLVKIHEKNQNMQKIDAIFKELLQSQNEITQQFVSIAQSYFKTGVTNKCFFLDHFFPLGIKGQVNRVLQPSAKQRLNQLLIEIVRYLYSVKYQYKMSNEDISSSIYQLKQYFPYASCLLMLFLHDQFCISQTAYNAVILQQIYLFLRAFYDKQDNCYRNIQILEPEIFVVSAILSYEYLAFMKQFFILDQNFNPYYQKFQSQIPEIQTRKVREQYSQKIQNFILRQCRTISKISETQNIQQKLQSLKYRIVKLDRSYLQEVVAKMAMNCFVNYQQLSDMKDLLKTRINNLAEGEVQPHLYKYYYDYLFKIAKLYRSLDEQISIYDVIDYIKTHDTKDYKYLIQYFWVQVGKSSKQANFFDIVRSSIQNIHELMQKVTGSLKSQTIRKHTVLKITLQQYGEVLDGLKLALGTDRSFQNLQSMGLYYFIQGDYERALRFLKEAFIIKQDEYHLNRAIFISMIKTKQLKQAYSFLERIYEGFPNVYWINYTLAINCINNRKFEQGYKYLSSALQAFTNGIAKKYKFSYEKTIQGKKYSLLYMIDQNNIHLLSDYFVVPESKIYQLFPMASSIFYDSNQELKQIKIQTQLGQILKILGRNKSSFNHLASAHMMLTLLPEQKRDKNILQVILTKKQYATMLFYVRAYKQAEQLFRETLKICSKQQSTQQISKQLLTVYQSEINSLLFEVSVMRLDQLMKFQSYEAVQQYINKFHESLKQIQNLVLKPSLNYYKAKYQFYILCYLHNKNLGVDQSIATIKEFLAFFALDVQNIESDKFYNRLVELKNQQRIIVKECLQDYFVLIYMKQNTKNISQSDKIIAQNIFPLIQLFPTSSVFYIVYGMAVQETKLKIASFLKCIQLDRESPISVDLLASLFLKQKDYITACKLFLKSLEIDLFNPKSFIGLCTCLYVLIGSAIKRGQPEDKTIIRRALNKINSYMQFLRIVDPSENYHMLKFLKTLISDEPIPLFELKAGLEQSRKLTAHKYSQKLLYQLLQTSTTYLKSLNIWTEQGQQQILKKYLQTNALNPNNDLHQMGVQLLNKLQKQIGQLKLEQIKSGQIVIKIKCQMLNRLCICGNIFAKVQQFKQQNIDKYIRICGMLQQKSQNQDSQLKNLQKTTKQVLISSIIKSQNRKESNITSTLQQIKQINLFKVFKNNPTFEHIQTYLDHFERQKYLIPLRRYIFINLHCFPTQPILRKALLSWLLIVDKSNNKINKKIKSCVDYRLDSIFTMNSDEQANNMERHHKKFAIMYNIQQPNAWIGFISQQWKRKKQTKWIGHLNKILTKYSDKQNILTVQSRKKAEWLLIQMSASALAQNEKIKQNQNQKLQKNITELHKVFEVVNQQGNKIGPILRNLNVDNQLNLMKYVVPYIVRKYEYSNKIEQIIDKCINQSKEPETKGYFSLLKFISVCGKPSKNEDQLVQQLKKLLQIIAQSESEVKTVHIHTNAIAIMKCFVAILSLNYQQLQQELNYAYVSNRFAVYSDQVLINYFEVMKVYREVQLNHQGENVFENFVEYINGMIGLVKEPHLKGFFFGLKAMAGAIVAEETATALSRQLRYALHLAPQSGKQMLKSSSQK